MACPDIELLIGYVVDGVEDSELATHARSCENCRADLRTIRVLAGDGEDNQLSEELVARIMASLPPASA